MFDIAHIRELLNELPFRDGKYQVMAHIECIASLVPNGLRDKAVEAVKKETTNRFQKDLPLDYFNSGTDGNRSGPAKPALLRLKRSFQMQEITLVRKSAEALSNLSTPKQAVSLLNAPTYKFPPLIN